MKHLSLSFDEYAENSNFQSLKANNVKAVHRLIPG